MADTETTVSTMTAGPESSPEAASTSAESTPSSEPQATEPQAQPQTESTPSVETPALSPRERLKQTLQDPELQSAYREVLNAEAQRIADKKLKRERLARAKEDPAAALEYAQSEAQEVEAEDAKASEHAAHFAKAERDLADLWRNKEWAEVYNDLRSREGDKFHSEWAKDPAAFVDAIDDRITNIIIDRKASAKAKVMAEAMSLEETNKRLGNLPVPPTGSGGSGGVPTLAEIEAMSPEEYRRHRDKVLASLDQYRR